MASRRTKRTLKKAESVDVDENISSPGSNDVEFDITTLITLKAKRLAQQKTANQKLKTEVADAIEQVRVRSITNFRNGIDEISKAFDNFRLEQAAIQDEIRTLWLQLIGTHSEVVKHTDEHFEKLGTLEDLRAENFLAALATERRACDDHRMNIDELVKLSK